jgi:hypothetical protein
MPSIYTWPLAAPPAPSPGSGGGTEDDAASLLFGGGGKQRRGILTPFRRGANDVNVGEGVQLLNSEIRQVLGTLCDSSASSGELPWRTDFGSKLSLSRHRNNGPVLAELVNQWVVDAISRWLTLVRVVRTVVEPSSFGDTTIVVRVYWEAIARGGQTLGSGDTSVPLTAVGRP